MENENKIQDYVHGHLNEVDHKAFEQKLATDASLRNEVEEYKNLQKSIQIAERKSLKERLQQLDQQDTANDSTQIEPFIKRLRPYLLPLAAASVIFIALIGKDYFFSSVSDDDLYATFYSSYPNTLQPITRGTEKPNAETKAFIAYESGDYKTASDLFKKILKSKTDPDLKFYYSMSLLNSGNDKKALPLLNELKKDSTLYIPQTYWYAALIELKNGNKQRSKELIDSLQLLNADFKTEAAMELEKKLN
jgi:predicted Zn-dependent protease